MSFNSNLLDLVPREQLNAPIMPPPTAIQAALDVFDLARQETALGSIARMASMPIGEEGDQVISAEDANRMASERGIALGESFSGLIYKPRFDEILDRQERNQMIMQSLFRRPESFMTTAGDFGIGIIAHGLDPLGIGASLAVGGALGVLARSGYSATKAARISGIVAGKLAPGQQFMRSVIDGVVGNVATEPLTYFANKQEHRDYTAADAFAGIAMGTIGFAGLRYAGSKLVRSFRNIDPVIKQEADNAVIGQVADGRLPDVEIVTDHLNTRLYNRLPSEAVLKADDGVELRPSGYKFIPVVDDSDIKEITWYASSSSGKREFKSNRMAEVEDTYGVGLYMSDDPNFSNNNANLKNKDGGRIWQTSIRKDLVTLDVSQPIRPDLKDGLKTFLKGLGLTDSASKEMANFKSIDEIYDRIKAIADFSEERQVRIDRLNKFFNDNGYDGIRRIGGNAFDKGGDPHNIVMLFNDDKIAVERSFKTERGFEPKPDMVKVDAQRKKSIGKQSKMDFDDKADAEAESFLGKPDKPIKMEDIASASKDAMDMVRASDEKMAEAIQMKTDMLSGEERAGVKILAAIKDCILRG